MEIGRRRKIAERERDIDEKILVSAWDLPSVCSKSDTYLALIQNGTLSFSRQYSF